jgi:2-dehydro-3-deoxygalactonokinase
MPDQPFLVAIDWGTSSLRAALLDADGHVRQERSLPRGILTVPAGEFPAVFAQAVAGWPAQPGTPCLMSGMVGSRQGWVEAPYCACPAGFADLADKLAWVRPQHIAIVPGLSCEHAEVPDVMRGEETQVFGAIDLLGLHEALVVLPGTHSKWVRVIGGRIESFSTFMTGEFYALLRQHSILARTMPADDGALNEAAFVRGIQHAARSANLLHAAFSARTLSLFEQLPSDALPSYLSGLVIGEELRSQPLQGNTAPVVIVGSNALTARYQIALKSHGVTAACIGSEATWRGLWALARHMKAIA